jgi:hypothetical protein
VGSNSAQTDDTYSTPPLWFRATYSTSWQARQPSASTQVGEQQVSDPFSLDQRAKIPAAHEAGTRKNLKDNEKGKDLYEPTPKV